MAADFGDAPAPYPTTVAEGGAQHVAIGPMLGTARDQEDDGVHSASANGDGADEDGVVFGTLRVGQLNATAMVTVIAGAKLDAWIDFDGDGNWGGAGETIAENRPVTPGQNSIAFDIPSNAITGVVYARFRVSSQGNLGISGAAADGEVEDYAITIEPPARASGQFNTGQDVARSLSSVQNAIALDVDNDGHMDLVSADYGIDEISWHRRDQFGAYSKHTIASGVDGAKSVFAADVNGDGKTDVISASQLGNALYWHEFTGGFGFTSHTISANAPKASTVVAADLDGDGDTDVISGGNNAVRWFENTGNSFTPHALPSPGTGITSVAVANLDGDGDLDILYAANGSNVVGWFKNNGSEVFSNQPITTTAGGASSVAAADFDDDGDMDVLSTSVGTVVWYENRGAQGFTTRVVSSTALEAGSVAVADLDGDGDLDVLAGSGIDNTIAWYQNNGSQTFVERIIATDASSLRSVGAADLDGDGDLDVFAAQAGNARLRRFENRALGNYAVDAAVDGADFLLWQRTLGFTIPSRGADADGDGSGVIDAADLALWRQGFGQVEQSTGGVVGSVGFEHASSEIALPGNAFLSADLFAERSAASSSLPLLAKQESQQTISLQIRDAALAALPAAPQAVIALNPLLEASDDVDELTPPHEDTIEGWRLGLK